ncbi:arabinogalactan endo-1,4-beta-galactosidase, partial [Weissella cibaria]|uniref:glycosyl hydrolase 53 family protein n=2 Tax=Weissella cibaria TaxID=137591 RepID=UPI0021B02B9F
NAEGKTYGAGDPTLKNAINTAKLAKAAGLKVNVDFVYSDFTSGNKAPKDWPTDMTQLQSKVTDYTQASLQALKDADAMPDMVTVGSNLGEDFLGQKDLPNIATLIGTATATIRKADEKIKIAVNFAKPSGDWTTSIAQALKDANVDYDIFGVTIFPAWDKLSDIADAQKAVESTFNKEFAVMSVSYPFTAQDSDGKDNGSTASDVAQNLGEVSPQGQATYMHELYKQLTATDSASGAFYDNANWIATVPGNSGDAWQKNQDNAEKFGTGWATTAGAGYVDGADQWAGANSVDNQALFDDLGQPLQSLKMFAQMTPSEDNPVAGNDDSAANVLKPTKPADPFEVGTDTGLKDQKVNFTKLPGVNNQTIRGVDISSYTALKNAGVKFYDFNGQQASLLKVLADSGVNYIRLRIWNDPTNDDGDTYGGGASDVANELKIAKEA